MREEKLPYIHFLEQPIRNSITRFANELRKRAGKKSEGMYR
jgi:hypothetical protein